MSNSIISYTDYLLDLTTKWPELQGLHDFMRVRPTSPQGYLIFAEVTDDAIFVNWFPNSEQSWRDALHQRYDSVKARICILEYEEATTVDREMLDACALLYDLDPFFLVEHFIGKGLPRKEISEVISVRLPSHRSVFKIGRTSICLVDTMVSGLKYGFEAFLLHNSKGPYEFPHPNFAMPEIERPSIHNAASQLRELSRGTILDCYMSIIRSWTREKISVSSAQPVYLLLPFLELAIVQITAQVIRTTQAWNERQLLKDTEIKELYKQIRHHEVRLWAYENALYKIGNTILVWKGKSEKSSEFSIHLAKLHEDIQGAVLMVRRGVEDLDRMKSNWTWKRAMLDVHSTGMRSDNNYTSIGLALFLFPILLVTSIFGMDIQGFRSGTTPIWQAILSAIIGILLAIFLLSIFGPTTKRRKE